MVARACADRSLIGSGHATRALAPEPAPAPARRTLLIAVGSLVALDRTIWHWCSFDGATEADSNVALGARGCRSRPTWEGAPSLATAQSEP